MGEYPGAQPCLDRQTLNTSLKKRTPINAWLYGKPGIGKIVVVKWVLEQLLEQTATQGIYVNCWQHRTLFSIADKLIADLKIFFAERQDVN